MRGKRESNTTGITPKKEAFAKLCKLDKFSKRLSRKCHKAQIKFSSVFISFGFRTKSRPFTYNNGMLSRTYNISAASDRK